MPARRVGQSVDGEDAAAAKVVHFGEASGGENPADRWSAARRQHPASIWVQRRADRRCKAGIASLASGPSCRKRMRSLSVERIVVEPRHRAGGAFFFRISATPTSPDRASAGRVAGTDEVIRNSSASLFQETGAGRATAGLRYQSRNTCSMACRPSASRAMNQIARAVMTRSLAETCARGRAGGATEGWRRPSGGTNASSTRNSGVVVIEEFRQQCEMLFIAQVGRFGIEPPRPPNLGAKVVVFPVMYAALDTIFPHI